jgi:hypothetical protein
MFFYYGDESGNGWSVVPDNTYSSVYDSCVTITAPASVAIGGMMHNFAPIFPSGVYGFDYSYWIPAGAIRMYLRLKATSAAGFIVSFDVCEPDGYTPTGVITNQMDAVSIVVTPPGVWTSTNARFALPVGLTIPANHFLCAAISVTATTGTPTVCLGMTVGNQSRINGDW